MKGPPEVMWTEFRYSLVLVVLLGLSAYRFVVDKPVTGGLLLGLAMIWAAVVASYRKAG